MQNSTGHVVKEFIVDNRTGVKVPISQLEERRNDVGPFMEARRQSQMDKMYQTAAANISVTNLD